MKKSIILIGLFSLVLFGAGMQVAKPTMASGNLEPALENVTKLTFIENKPAQITLNIPTNIENPEGLKTLINGKEVEVNAKVFIHCKIYSSYQPVIFHTIEEVQTGSSTVSIKVNGLPVDKISYINKYICSYAFTDKSTEQKVAASYFETQLDSSSTKKLVGEI